MPEWEEHCPIDEDASPVKRRAWRDGWKYCVEHGPGVPDQDEASEQGGHMLTLTWLPGYSAADQIQRS